MKGLFMNVILIYVLFPSKSEALNCAKILLQKKTIFCANLIEGVTSQYIWQNEIQKSDEVIQIFKTTGPNKEKVIRDIEKNHSYEAPAILEISSKSHNQKYSDWISELFLNKS